MQITELKDFAIDKIEDIKARDITVLDVQQHSTITDYMIIASGTSKTHVKSIAEYLVVEAKKAEIEIIGIEGRESSEWVLVDLGDVVVHVMQEQARDFYQLEKLWN
ncbi:ribosome silencing factor [Paraferrimonas sp. SM1919]|uniref:ribosome silencing factor n=1 Tax=Paraferrimonas sp. SM1919 TaxID=2662263 RepID=UPI0013D127C8|nr:ribosome silencing factor [Paraferrimonas sp. SM1919]